MRWLINFLGSSLGQKIIMSLTGLFLISFLTVHLLGNLSLLSNDGGYTFNTYAYFMTTNPLIKFISIGLYFFIVLHTIQGLYITFKNRMARGSNRYAVKTKDNTSFSSRNMALLGTLVLAFLFIHMGDFWLRMKLDWLPTVTYDGYAEPIADLYGRVAMQFQNPLIVIAYVIGQIVLALHLWHGFQSAFQSLGLNHPKYTPFIKGLGKAYSILIPAGFALIPIVHFLFK